MRLLFQLDRLQLLAGGVEDGDCLVARHEDLVAGPDGHSPRLDHAERDRRLLVVANQGGVNLRILFEIVVERLGQFVALVARRVDPHDGGHADANRNADNNDNCGGHDGTVFCCVHCNFSLSRGALAVRKQ